MDSSVVVFRQWYSCTENDNVESSWTCGRLGGLTWTLSRLHTWESKCSWTWVEEDLATPPVALPLLHIAPGSTYGRQVGVPRGDPSWLVMVAARASSQHDFLATGPAWVFLRALESLGWKDKGYGVCQTDIMWQSLRPQGLCWPPAITVGQLIQLPHRVWGLLHTHEGQQEPVKFRGVPLK